MSAEHQEIELKLTVLEPAALDEPFSWRSLGGYVLQPAMPRRIHDRYWDTTTGKLAQSGLNLRLRQLDQVELFTLKGAATVRDGLFSRSELEVPANRDGWLEVRAELQEHGVSLAEPGADETQPANWLAGAGLQITQDRSTFRRRLFALDGDRPVAEIALDSTTFHLAEIDVTIREIEIESLTSQSGGVLTLGKALRQQLGKRVVPSAVGKYGVGLALEGRLKDFNPDSK